jgi:hypothetical protein
MNMFFSRSNFVVRTFEFCLFMVWGAKVRIVRCFQNLSDLSRNVSRNNK